MSDEKPKMFDLDKCKRIVWAVFLGCEESVAKDISNELQGLICAYEELRAENEGLYLKQANEVFPVALRDRTLLNLEHERDDLAAQVKVRDAVIAKFEEQVGQLKFEVQDKTSSRDNYREMVQMNLQVIEELRNWKREQILVFKPVLEFEHPEMRLGESKVAFLLKLAKERDDFKQQLEASEDMRKLVISKGDALIEKELQRVRGLSAALINFTNSSKLEEQFPLTCKFAKEALEKWGILK